MLDVKATKVPMTFPVRDGMAWLDRLRGSRWNCWLPPSSPVEEVRDLPEPGKRLRGFMRYANWLNDTNPCGGKGVYLWLVPRPGARGGLRFIHVGMTTGSMRVRTRHHCLQQFRCGGKEWCESNEWCTFDLIHRLPLEGKYSDGLGSLGAPLWDSEWDRERAKSCAPKEIRFEAAKHFLKELRVLYLAPVDSDCANDQIKAMEAVIGVAAAQLLDPDFTTETKRGRETTNTLSGKMGSMRRAELNPSELQVVAAWLNSIEPMLPEQRRRKT